MSPRYSIRSRSLKGAKSINELTIPHCVFEFKLPSCRFKKEALSATSFFRKCVPLPMNRLLRICCRVSGIPLFTLSKISRRARSGTFESMM